MPSRRLLFSISPLAIGLAVLKPTNIHSLLCEESSFFIGHDFLLFVYRNYSSVDHILSDDSQFVATFVVYVETVTMQFPLFGIFGLAFVFFFHIFSQLGQRVHQFRLHGGHDHLKRDWNHFVVQTKPLRTFFFCDDQSRRVDLDLALSAGSVDFWPGKFVFDLAQAQLQALSILGEKLLTVAG